jgi:hypothetical protein
MRKLTLNAVLMMLSREIGLSLLEPGPDPIACLEGAINDQRNLWILMTPDAL